MPSITENCSLIVVVIWSHNNIVNLLQCPYLAYHFSPLTDRNEYLGAFAVENLTAYSKNFKNQNTCRVTILCWGNLRNEAYNNY